MFLTSDGTNLPVLTLDSLTSLTKSGDLELSQSQRGVIKLHGGWESPSHTGENLLARTTVMISSQGDLKNLGLFASTGNTLKGLDCILGRHTRAYE